jgi:AAHS family 4-hydroxybenzoate transporter-like MFS transporter
VSWANGIGRSGSIVGSLTGGAMLAQGWSLPTIYSLVAIPAVISATAILVLGVVTPRDRAGQAKAGNQDMANWPPT